MKDDQTLKIILIDDTTYIINFYNIDFIDTLIRIYSENGIYTFKKNRIKSIFI